MAQTAKTNQQMGMNMRENTINLHDSYQKPKTHLKKTLLCQYKTEKMKCTVIRDTTAQNVSKMT